MTLLDKINYYFYTQQARDNSKRLVRLAHKETSEIVNVMTPFELLELISETLGELE